MKEYYKTGADTDTGRRVARFHRLAGEAEAAAMAYAKEMGASAYIEPSQYFAGGVEFLEFDKKPDGDVWRLRGVGDCVTLYEPNCRVTEGFVILAEDEEIPADTDTVYYGSRRFEWRDVCSARPVVFWAALLGYRLTGDNLADWKHIESRLSDKRFVVTMEYEGADEAVRAERKRILLPVVETSAFYKAIGIDSPAGSEATPVFFLFGGSYYIGLPDGCAAPSSLTPVSEVEYKMAAKAATDR